MDQYDDFAKQTSHMLRYEGDGGEMHGWGISLKDTANHLKLNENREMLSNRIESGWKAIL